MNDDMNGPSNAMRMNFETWCVISNRISDLVRYRKIDAPIRASLQLLTNQHRLIVIGIFALSCTKRCAGNAASRRYHHERVRESNNAASRIEFGGQRVETG